MPDNRRSHCVDLFGVALGAQTALRLTGQSLLKLRSAGGDMCT